jgi:small-conductance mechanosensitive channel
MADIGRSAGCDGMGGIAAHASGLRQALHRQAGAASWGMGVFRFAVLFALLVAGIGGGRLLAQEVVPSAEPPAPVPPTEQVAAALDPVLRNAPAALRTLETLQIAIGNLREQLDQQKRALAATEVESERYAIIRTIDDLALRLRQLEDDFRGVATGIDLADFQTAADQAFEWQHQLRELLRPLLAEMQQATADPREMEHLRSLVVELENRRTMARRAASNVADLIGRTDNTELADRLRAELATWETYLAESSGQLEAARYQLAERQRAHPSVFGRLSHALAKFFRSRGLNLLIAIVIFVGVIIIARRLHHLAGRRMRSRRIGDPGFSARLLNLIFYAFVVIAAVMAALTSLYMADDWVLLTLAIIFLIAIFWGLKNTIPTMIEQIRILLNLGSIRQDERVIYNGLPWKVGTLNFFTNFTNPALEGALLRLPIRELQDMVSRPCVPGELWFPTELEDWVILEDDTYGKVVQQNPDFVQLVQLGGVRKTYRTSEFLNKNPRNLSHNFRVASRFGIDYEHQKIATTQVPDILQQEIEQGLLAEFGEQFLSLKVEFAAAASSSLDYEIIADFSGELGSRYRFINRLLQRLAVDSCNRHGWVIPFTQITLHQAAVASAGRP